MKLATKVTSAFDRTMGILASVGGGLLIFVMLIMCAEIVSRLIVGHSILGVMDIAEYSLLFILFLGTTWVLKREEHVKMEFVINRLSPGAQSILNSITSTVAALICLLIAWFGVKVTVECFHSGYYFPKVLTIPAYFILFIIPIGSLLLFIQFLRRTRGYLKSWRTSKEQGVSGAPRLNP